MTIGNRIKKLRLSNHYSQKDLSIKSGLSKRTIQRIEKNHVTPSIKTLKLLGEIFEENLHQFENENRLTNKKQELNKIYILWNSIVKLNISFLRLFLKK